MVAMSAAAAVAAELNVDYLGQSSVLSRFVGSISQTGPPRVTGVTELRGLLLVSGLRYCGPSLDSRRRFKGSKSY